MKNILLIIDAYYPNSRATIVIMQRIAEMLTRNGNKLTVLTNKQEAENISKHNGVDILYMEDEYQRSNTFVHKIIGKIYDFWYTKKYRLSYEYGVLYRHSRSIRRIAKERKIDCIISVSLPMIHHLSARMSLNHWGKQCWIPICLDPFAFSQEISEYEQRNRLALELKEYRKAKRIFMLVESQKDYQNSLLNSKITYFALPNIRLLQSGTNEIDFFNKDNINCLFIGSLFFSVRNPERLLQVFCKFNEPRIKLFIVGGMYGAFPENYMEEWERRSNGRIKYFSRVDNQRAIDLMLAADILVNIGNITTNQCPSKVLDYISTGKPILNISKVENCTSLHYLKEYPLAKSFFEQNILEERVQEVESFLIESKGKEISFDKIKELYPTCLPGKVVSKIEEYIND